ncbi:hypothetical protein OJF2_67620 [Aquisphaera giovannonii]|uniref:Type II secretion system protein G n=1 Tax=Aquisphaera giovannonii TaxID=406548 RepID=A0A5B9WD11_9BACT|nr:prepilin-type N-terminal cleavage/methylation domain-containing protein [Aquisphaera giovannonii]QEH38164.1 hypothetical protein OJF2_67620 [Aquisphaera giovannonii]
MRNQRPRATPRSRQAGGDGTPPGGCESHRAARRAAFTLVELLTVIAIIGIIITLILIAASGAQRQAEMAATQSLIAKLDSAMNDRLDALLQTRPDYNLTHRYMASVYYTDSNGVSRQSESQARAQVIAWYDFIKAEMPDVFYVYNTTGPYPLNFAFPESGLPGTPIDSQGLGHVMLPLGNSLRNNPSGNSFGDSNFSNTVGTGIYGASYFAAAGVYKNLGYLPAGWDGADNSTSSVSGGAGLVDEWGEGVNSTNSAQVVANLTNHKHHTARAEMLYALLVEGVGPLGSAFSRDDFTDREVRDTDGDGLPEFVDAWGNPLQFFRWPILYPTDVQRGQSEVVDSGTGLLTLLPPYYSTSATAATFLPRENSPLDPNNLLVAPAWWSATQNPMSPFGMGATSQNGSPAVTLFENFFHRLTEPLQHTGSVMDYWDRGGSADFGYRRAFYTRPLILSSGPDGAPGVYLIPDGGTSSMPLNAAHLIRFENNALIFDPVEAGFNGEVLGIQSFGAASKSYAIWQAGKDDITNQNRQTAGGGGGS